MAIDEQRTRQSLHSKLADALGVDEAALLMDYLPPVGWADIATKRDVEMLRVEMGALRSGVDARISDLKSSLLMWLVPTILATVVGTVTLSNHL